MTHLTRYDEVGKWYPNTISELNSHLAQLIKAHPDLPSSKCDALIKNVSYSLQHLEFLHRVHEDIKMSEVLSKQNIKTFLIVGASILEALFFYILVSNQKAAMAEWKSVAKVESQEFEEGGVKKKLLSDILVKLKKLVLEEMTFDAMCKKVESRKLARLTNEEFYKHLPTFERYGIACIFIQVNMVQTPTISRLDRRT